MLQFASAINFLLLSWEERRSGLFEGRCDYWRSGQQAAGAGSPHRCGLFHHAFRQGVV